VGEEGSIISLKPATQVPLESASSNLYFQSDRKNKWEKYLLMFTELLVSTQSFRLGMGIDGMNKAPQLFHAFVLQLCMNLCSLVKPHPLVQKGSKPHPLLQIIL
jgi:hypothetical protein